ncbi:hypothetical protein HMPREF2942_08240 [Rothia sp. HMSC071C12]|nr:hypothetical protein HMPREF2942_08240 [Rothia sp. HMSC071C12]
MLKCNFSLPIRVLDNQRKHEKSMPMRVIRQKIQKLRPWFMQSPNPKKTAQQRNKTGNITSTKNSTQQRLHQQRQYHKAGTQKGR